MWGVGVVVGAGFQLLVGGSLVVVMWWWSYGWGNLSSLPALFPAVLLLVTLGWAVAALCGLANVFFPDAKHLLEIGLQILFYATPIIYRPDLLQERGLGWLVDYNPLVAVLEIVRAPVIDGQIPSLGTYGVAGGLTALAVGAAAWMLARWQRTLIYHL